MTNSLVHSADCIGSIPPVLWKIGRFTGLIRLADAVPTEAANPPVVMTAEQIRWLNEADAYDAQADSKEVEIARANHQAQEYARAGNRHMELLMRDLSAALNRLVVVLRNNARQARGFAQRSAA